MLVTHGPLAAVTAAYAAAKAAAPPVGSGAPHAGRLAITVGNFDGVHRGHQAMLQRLKEKAAELGVRTCVLTFEPHPREFFAPQTAPARLTRLSAKLHVLRDAGVDRVHVARFDAEFSSQQPGRFIEDVLVKGLGCAWLLVGHDFRFGAKRAGDFVQLEEAARLHGFQLEAMPEVRNAGARISSSSVREALKRGGLEEASALLGRPYSIAGRVTHGDKLGRELGFATANIRLPHPPALAGIFVVEVLGLPQAPGSTWPAVASIGVRPTVKENDVPLLEVHLFDFDQDLYGRRLEVRFLHKLRDEEKYPDLETLKNAIARDAADAREFFAAKSHG
jgi:riboflavin kinase/FMN adenylyltransferase